MFTSVMVFPFGSGCVETFIISPAGSITLCTTHRSQPGAARLACGGLLVAVDAPPAMGRSVCQPGAVGGLYGQHGRTVRPAAALINHNPW